MAASVVAAGVLAAPGPAASAPTQHRAGTDNRPARIASNWLAGELTNGLMVGAHGTDYGLTIDTGLAMANANKRRVVTAIRFPGVRPRCLISRLLRSRTQASPAATYKQLEGAWRLGLRGIHDIL